jgi:putative transposase
LARKTRIFIENIPVHILLKSLNSMDIFLDLEDQNYFKKLIKKILAQASLEIHSYLLSKNSFEFLATPKDIDVIPKFMQSLGRQYVVYYNKKYDRTGTLWDGRYKSSIVEPNNLLFDVMFYIETNSDSLTSSYNKNFEDKEDSLITYHKLYKDLGFTQDTRIKNYKELFNDFTEEKSSFVASCIDKQNITASKNFINDLENKLGILLQTKKRGRPKKIKKDKKMYKNLQLLDKEKHKALKVSPMSDLFFAKELNSIPVMLNEVANVSQTFPVVFSKGENANLISLISIGSGNLAVNPEGKWITNYLPIALRKYPFAIGSVKDKPEQKLIMIDEDSPLVSKSKGKQLFKKDGEQSELLENAIKFLKQSEQQVQITKKIVEEIEKSGILEDREISVGEGEEKKVLISGFQVVDKDKLNKLSDDILASWVRRGIITFIDSHLKSLDNINLLFNLANQRQN